jgi:hypothetical protein
VLNQLLEQMVQVEVQNGEELLVLEAGQLHLLEGVRSLLVAEEVLVVE